MTFASNANMCICAECNKLFECWPVTETNYCNACFAEHLPFFSISNLEFKLLTETKLTDCNYIYDDYISPSKLSKISSNASSNDLFLVHLNVRSLSQNIDKLEELF